MTTVDDCVIGYADRLSVRPGGRVSFFVSCTAPDYRVEYVRLGRGTGGVVESPVLPRHRRRCVGRRQNTTPGSFVLVPDVGRAPHDADRLYVGLWCLPTVLPGRTQTLVAMQDAESGAGWALLLNREGRIEYRVGDDRVILGQPLRERRWSAVLAGHDRRAGVVHIAVQERDRPDTVELLLRARCGPSATDAPNQLLIGARAGRAGPADHFTGRLADVRLWRDIPTTVPIEALAGEPTAGLLFWWDFGARIESTTAVDRGPAGRHGRLVNHPTRAVAGPRWTGEYLSFRERPDHYGALHLHADDIADAGWDVDFVLDVPAELPSGVYAARCAAGDHVDHVAFVVTPGEDGPRARAVVVLPTFTYLAYANNRVALERDFLATGAVGRATHHDRCLDLLRQHPEWGRSLYDLHEDGSGCVYSSRLRPMLNLRPGYTHWISGGPRNFSADLCLLHWLDTLGFAVDVITDEQVHRQGTAALRPYRVVLTGSHPEYCTAPMLDAFTRYRNTGGRLMYLGGNGFYWVTSTHGEFDEIVEVRRGYAGTRPWTSEPGELHHAATGELGGLWRHRGRPPNALVGVGFTAQGWDERARPYLRTPAAYEDRHRWVFDGIDDDAPIGAFGLVMGGAAGDEIDRADPRLGGADAVVLASSTGHSDHYCLAVEDVEQTGPNVLGSHSALVRADLVYQELPDGGLVFSVGSMAWVGSLPINECDNNVSTVTANVLRRFLRDDGPRPGIRHQPTTEEDRR